MQQQDPEIEPLHDQEMKPTQQPQPQRAEKCPRCQSFNTKFCYYNNYSLSQPRYFCKACRRYWTHGGTLRNVPVGGGCRKGKRPKTTPSSSSQPSPDFQRNKPSPNDQVMFNSSVSSPKAIETGAFGSFCYQGGGYLPAMEAALNQPQFFAQSVNIAGAPPSAGVAVYSFGSEHGWSRQSFNNSNPVLSVTDASMWTINVGAADSSAGDKR